MKASARGLLTALALGVTLIGLAGCASADTAISIDGRTYSEAEARLAADQLNELGVSQEPLQVRDVVEALVTTPFIIEHAEGSGQIQPEAATLAAVRERVPEPSETTVDLLRAQNALQYLDDAGRQAILKAVSEADITVNPRYGSVDRNTLTLTPSAPNWLTPAATTPAPAPTQ